MPTTTATEAVFRALWDLWVADANKFGGSAAADQVRDLLEVGDQRLTPAEGSNASNLTMPYLIVDLGDEQDDALGPGTGAVSNLGGEILFTLRIVTPRDRGGGFPSGESYAQTPAKAIAAALRIKLHEQDIQSAAVTTMGWRLSRPTRLGGGKGVSDGLRNVDIERYSLSAVQIAGA